MHPAYSVIFFTTASGAGYGLLFWLSLAHLIGRGPGNEASVLALILATVLVTAGLLSSTFHLGRPERAWRAFSQWRSSWLSREGVVAVLEPRSSATRRRARRGLVAHERDRARGRRRRDAHEQTRGRALTRHSRGRVHAIIPDSTPDLRRARHVRARDHTCSAQSRRGAARTRRRAAHRDRPVHRARVPTRGRCHQG